MTETQKPYSISDFVHNCRSEGFASALETDLAETLQRHPRVRNLVNGAIIYFFSVHKKPSDRSLGKNEVTAEVEEYETLHLDNTNRPMEAYDLHPKNPLYIPEDPDYHIQHSRFPEIDFNPKIFPKSDDYIEPRFPEFKRIYVKPTR